MSRLRLVTATTAAALAGSLALSGCQGLLDLPLPGGAAQGSDVYHVTVEFRNVLDLVPQSAVKVNDATVGAVDRVTLDGWHARVRLRLEDSVRLPDNAVAELRQTSLLGEKFVSLAAPEDRAPTGRLGEGDTIPLARSGRNPEVEEVLGALSLLLNGGGVAQLKTINVELTKALRGRESDVRNLIRQLDVFVGGLDRQKSQIVRALDGVDRLAATLQQQRRGIATAIDDLGPGIEVLADQRRALTRLLTALSDLGRVGTRVVRESRADTVANLQALQPILGRLAEAGDNLPKALELAFTYPFPAQAATAVRGDFTNLRITADLDLRNILANLAPVGVPQLPSLPPLPTALPTTLPSDLPLPTGTRAPTLPPLPTVTVPTSLPSVPGVPVPTAPPLPTLPPLPGVPTSGSGGRCAIVVCLGAPQPRPAHGSVDGNLAELMTGGLA